MKVLCLGGNVCLGARSIRGWPEHLWEMTQWQIVNAALPGGRMIDVSRRVASMPYEGEPDWVVLQLGTYDARGGGVSPHEWGLMLDQTLDSILARWPSVSVLVCSPPSIFPSSVRGFNRHARRWVPRAARESKGIALDRGAQWLNLMGIPEEHFPDGIHPNRDGCREIADRVRERLA